MNWRIFGACELLRYWDIIVRNWDIDYVLIVVRNQDMIIRN